MKLEVDFVLRQGHRVSELINVCYSLENAKTLEREIKALEAGMAEFKNTKAKIIYWEGQPPRHKKIKFINILDFLLDRPAAEIVLSSDNKGQTSHFRSSSEVADKGQRGYAAKPSKNLT